MGTLNGLLTPGVAEDGKTIHSCFICALISFTQAFVHALFVELPILCLLSFSANPLKHALIHTSSEVEGQGSQSCMHSCIPPSQPISSSLHVTGAHKA